MYTINKASKFIFILIICIATQITVTYAQYNQTPTQITSEERAIFAFFRAAGEAPDFNAWIESKPEYEALPANRKHNYFVNEMMRLGGGYGNFDAEEDVLKLHLNIVSKYTPEKEKEDGETEKPKISFRILNSTESYTPTFDFSFGEDKISMIINNLATFSMLSLDEIQSAALKEKVPYEKDEFDSDLEIWVRVTRADFKNPIKHRDHKQWLMVGEIAQIKNIYNSSYGAEPILLWDYVAPWYEETLRIQNMPEEEKYPHPFDLFRK